MQTSKQIHIIAGPNGAGKSTSARVVLLPNWLKAAEFVNADDIAKALSPDKPQRSALEAGRVMLNRIESLLQEGSDFAFETTLSAKTYLNLIARAQQMGYKVNLIFLKLDNVELAYNRVLARVSKGGHNIELPVITRRFARGLANLKEYIKIVDTATVYEASGLELIEIAKKQDGEIIVVNKKIWDKIYDT